MKLGGKECYEPDELPIPPIWTAKIQPFSISFKKNELLFKKS